MMQRVLLVDDDKEVREALGQSLELADMAPILASSFIIAKDHISTDFEGVIVTDIRMPGRDGFHLLSYARSIDPELPVILLTGEGDIPTAVKAMEQGAHSFLEKPCAPNELIMLIEKASEARREVLENRRRKLEMESGDAAARMLFGRSAWPKDCDRGCARLLAPTRKSWSPGRRVPEHPRWPRSFIFFRQRRVIPLSNARRHR